MQNNPLSSPLPPRPLPPTPPPFAPPPFLPPQLNCHPLLILPISQPALLDQHEEPLCASPPPMKSKETHPRAHVQKKASDKRRPRGGPIAMRGSPLLPGERYSKSGTQFQLLGLSPEGGSSMLRENQRSGMRKGHASYYPDHQRDVIR